MKKFLNSISLLLDGDAVLNPLYEGISVVGPIAITVVLMLSIFWGIFLGVKYAKAEKADDKANAQKILINFVIGAVVVIILLFILFALRGPLTDFINGE